jgi:hypothetical protein
MPHRHHINPNAAGPAAPKRPRARRGRAEWVLGTLVEVDAERREIVLRVGTSRGASLRADEEVRIDVREARVVASDGDGDGHAGLRDLFPGDTLHVSLRARDADGPLIGHRVEQRSPGGPPGGLRRLWASHRR